MLRADLLSIRSDLVVVLIGEALDRKYFTELTDVAVDVPTFKFEVVGFFITFRIEVVTTFFNADASELIGSGIAVNLSEAGETIIVTAGSVEAVQLADEQERIQTVVIKQVANHEAQVVRVVAGLSVTVVGVADDDCERFIN